MGPKLEFTNVVEKNPYNRSLVKLLKEEKMNPLKFK
jgi:hypothetical protein